MVTVLVGQVTERGGYESKTWLIGTCPTTRVHIGHLEIDCLVDTGSQVSIISEEVVKILGLEISTYLNLELKAANGLKIIHSGNIRIDIELKGKMVKVVGFIV